MSATVADPRISADVLLDLKGADRSAKSYAFLYAAFRKTEISSSPVRDALDCLIPFIAPYLNTIPGKQVDHQAIQNFLRTKFGFNFPLYALEQLMPALVKAGLVEFNKVLKIHVAKSVPNSFEIVKSEIEVDFDRIADQLGEYARHLGVTSAPPSGSWGDALISFLKSQQEKPASVVTKIKGALLDPNQVEDAVVGGFIKGLFTRNYAEFEKIVQIFMGVLIEEFIASIAEIGTVKKAGQLNVFYDTAVLLRVLGCSGALLRVATEELTRYLQDVGCQIYFLPGNEAEVANILNTIIYVKDAGGELEGETAAAISDGEITITDLRMLQNSFAERLAAKNIFPADYLGGDVQELAKFQIDERAFSDYLLTEANKAKRAYGVQNRINDASYLATVMRLRRGARTRDLTESRFLFVTPNKFLASTARRFLVAQKVLQPQHCPPILSVGQVATIAWLMKDQAIVPEKGGP
jgi:hypothetical protein